MTTSNTIVKIAPALLNAQRTKNYQEEARLAPIAIKLIRKDLENRRTLRDRFMGRVIFGSSDCWYWSGFVDKNGYGVSTSFGVKRPHRLSWIIFKGDLPKDMDVLHKCDVRSCVNPEHLFLGTQADNVRDMISKGRHVYPKVKSGEANNMAKLTNEKVLEIREKRASGISVRDLMSEYRVSQMCIFRIVTRRSWRHI